MKAMGNTNFVQGFMLLAVLVLALLSTGCSQTVGAIQNRELSVQAKMSETIFLNPEVLEEKKKVYVRFTNTSDAQEIDISQALRQIITSKGMVVVSKASDADYFVNMNLLYMGLEREDLTGEGLLAGGFGGALAGTAVAGNNPLVGGIVGGLGGMAAGAAIGTLFKVDAYVGALDVQIKEPAPKGYKATVLTSTRENNATDTSTTSRNVTTEVSDTRSDHRTRIVASATQTNMDKGEAMKIIASRLATQVGGMF